MDALQDAWAERTIEPFIVDYSLPILKDLTLRRAPPF